MKNFSRLLLLTAVILTACKQVHNDENIIRVNLSPGFPTDQGGMRWSPKGEKLDLDKSGEGLLANLNLGPEGLSPIALRLSASEDGGHFDILEIDLDRDGQFGGAEDTVLSCTPNESRGKIWSSFSGNVMVPFEKVKGQKSLINPYPIALWYVFDPLGPQEEPVIRFSRRGWMEGQAETDFGSIRVLLTESLMDGVFDRNDSWAITMDSTRKDLFNIKSSKGIDIHNWLGDQAFGIDSVLPSGRIVWIKPVDPRITREEEEAQNDYLAVDRAAKRSGGKVNFLHDFKSALNLAKQHKQKLLIDFETTWCGPCKTMDQWVYTADTVIEVSRDFICVKVDGDENRDLVKKYDVTGYPTLILASPEGEILKKFSGYQSVLKTVDFLKY